MYDGSCTFDTMDKKWVAAYVEHEKKKGRKVNGIATDLHVMKYVFHKAMEDDITDRYPFHGIVLKKQQTRKRCLTLEQLRALRDFPLAGTKEMYRDCFMLGFYLIGINISDLLYLPKEAMKNGRIEYRRNKTGKLYDIRVEPEAMEIIKRHKSRKKELLLSFLEEANTPSVNYFANKLARNLRNVGHKDRTGVKVVKTPIESGITSYWARHTWATLASEIDIPMEIIGRALGHSLWENAVTSVYISFDRKKVDEANRKVIDYLNSDKN